MPFARDWSDIVRFPTTPDEHMEPGDQATPGSTSIEKTVLGPHFCVEFVQSGESPRFQVGDSFADRGQVV
jgi:hypothetical protein